MVQDAEFRGLQASLVGEKANWGMGEAYSRVFKANMSIDSKVIDWLRATVAEYGIVID